MVKPRKIPLRVCVGCQERKPKKSLVRIVSIPEGPVEVDMTGKKSGRGVYICPNKTCMDRACKGKRLEKNLKREIPASLKEEIYRMLEEDDHDGNYLSF